MKLHLFYNHHKNDPLCNCCGIDVHKRIERIEYEIFMRTKVRHMWNIETLCTNNNITTTI